MEMGVAGKSKVPMSRVVRAFLCLLVFGLFGLFSAFGAAAFVIATDSNAPAVLADLLPYPQFVQGEEASPASDVTPEQISKYVKVYEAMRADRNLTVDQAAGKQGLSLDDFRELESKIERDDLVRDRVRRELEQHAEKHSTTKQAESAVSGSSSGGGASEKAP